MTNYIYGIHAVTAFLEKTPEQVKQLWLQDGRQDKRVMTLQTMAQRLEIDVQTTSTKHLDKMLPSANHQGVIAQIISQGKTFTEDDLPQLLEQAQPKPFILVLDGVTDPHNLGACLRTADAAGIHFVIAPKDNAASLTPVVRKVACGAAESVPFITVTNLARTLAWLKQQGVWLFGTAGEAEQTIYQAEMTGAVAIVMGAEGSGLRRLTKEHCDYLIKIPMSGTVSSLNVSVATGVCLFEAIRQRSMTLL